VGKTWNKYTML